MAKFHELALLCHEHAATCKLPDLDPESSMQSRIESAINRKWEDLGERRSRKKRAGGKNPFFPGLVGHKLSDNQSKLLEKLREEDCTVEDLNFCLPVDVKNEVYSKPPSYHHIHSLQYLPTRPTRVPETGEHCNCIGYCGEACLNKVLYVECHGDSTHKGNCKVGNKCGNRQISQRKGKKTKPKREGGKGWGLVPVEAIAKGELVHEYIGEVIDGDEKEKRLMEWSKEHPNDPNFYIMALTPGWFIDARTTGNLSRFINHSCSPNCVLLPINVRGYMRCGIFALRDIQPNEFLSYDYHFDTQDGDKFLCRCGSPACRGTMKKTDEMLLAGVKKTKTELWEEAKNRFERDKKFIQEFYKNEEDRRSLVGASVPAAENRDELVSNGPQQRYLRDGLRKKTFLWRNAITGSDFPSRFERLQKK